MKKKIALVAVLFVVVALLVSCGNPKSLAGTRWEYSAAGTGGAWKFTATEANYVIMLLGVDSSPFSYTYTYDGTNVIIYDTYWSGTTYTYATGTVDGNKMTINGVTYKKK